MIEMKKPWEAPKEVVLAITDLALTHIKKVELNPEVKTDGDNFDYWNSYKLEDGTYVDYNIYCGDDFCILKQDGSGEYEYTDPSEWTWDVACYAVDPPTKDNPYHEIDTSRTQYLFSYNKDGNGEIVYED
jgi:hypothetical protein